MNQDAPKLDLTQFYGTEAYHKWSSLFQNFVMTDGASYLAEKASAYWLMDIIASHVKTYRFESMVVVKLKKGAKTWRVKFTDGNAHVLCSQTIPYSDFPLDEIELWVCPQDNRWVIMLPSEY